MVQLGLKLLRCYTRLVTLLLLVVVVVQMLAAVQED
jgi:hypothetical protein